MSSRSPSHDPGVLLPLGAGNLKLGMRQLVIQPLSGSAPAGVAEVEASGLGWGERMCEYSTGSHDHPPCFWEKELLLGRRWLADQHGLREGSRCQWRGWAVCPAPAFEKSVLLLTCSYL